MKFIAIAFLLLTVACKPLIEPLAGPHPADPSVAVPGVRYQSTLGSYVSRRPVEPGPWRQQNEQVAPKQER